jgi:hypothetical protein
MVSWDAAYRCSWRMDYLEAWLDVMAPTVEESYGSSLD